MKEDRKPTNAPLFVIGAQIYSNNGITHPCSMPLTIDNNLQSINTRFGSIQNHSEISFTSHIYSCAAMNVGNIKIHKWVITTHPEIVSHYIQYNNEKPFETIQINCAVEYYENMKYTYGKLTDLVVYNTYDFHPNYTKRIQIEFGFGKEVAVNAIIDIPTLKQRKASISFEGNFITSPLLQKKILLFINLLTLGYLPASPLTINNLYDLERLHIQVKT